MTIFKTNWMHFTREAVSPIKLGMRRPSLEIVLDGNEIKSRFYLIMTNLLIVQNSLDFTRMMYIPVDSEDAFQDRSCFPAIIS